MSYHAEGYERLTPLPSYNAVRWWYVDVDGDYVFARGGRVRTSRIARREIDNARDVKDFERGLHDRRPTHQLTADGDLVKLDLP